MPVNGRTHARRSRPARRPVASVAARARVEPLERRALFSSGYAYNVVAAFGDPLPRAGDGVYTGDFEPGGINERGQIVFTSDQGKPDAAHDQGQAVFLTQGNGGKPFKTLNLSNTPAPGGGTFGGFGSLSPDAVNDAGDATFAFTLLPAQSPLYHAGVYRYSHATGKVTAVVAPNVTKLADGTVLRGTSFAPSINARGDIAFVGVIDSTKGSFPAKKLAEGLFVAHKNGKIDRLITPGDAAPGGSTFDSVGLTSINDGGDVAFGGHLKADPVLGDDGTGLGGFQGVYVRNADKSVEAIARQGTPIPPTAGGGWYDVAFAPVVNNKGMVAFQAAISPTKPTGDPATEDPSKDPQGVFLYYKGRTIAVARPGDVVPGGAHIVRPAYQAATMHLNDKGEVVYSAELDDGTQGVFVWAAGVTAQLARTGAQLPGGREVASFDVFGRGYPSSLTANNDRGQVAFAVVLKGGGQALVLASPHGQPAVPPVSAKQPAAYAPGSLVAGKTVGQWAAGWWKQVFETPVHGAGGTAILNPNFDETGAQAARGDVGPVFNLFGSFSPGQHTRTAVVPTGKPIFVPVLPIEFSNFDTAAPDGSLPGHYTAAELAAQAKASADPVLTPGGELHMTVDGRPVPDLLLHREASPTFSYTLPATDNVDQFFGLNFKGKVAPAVADGFYTMLRPLSAGKHVVSFGGTIPSSSPLGAFSIDVTYELTVRPAPSVYAPHATVNGKSLGAWSAAWFQWATSIPANVNPALDLTGADANRRQSGPVYFLAGAGLSDPVTRSFTVPAGKKLFFPIVNEIWLFTPGDPTSVPALRGLIGPDIASAANLSASVDGHTIGDVRGHREKDPFANGFSVTLPADNLFQAPGGTYQPCVSDGYWLMLDPLSVGKHTIRFTAKLANGFAQDVALNLTVA